MRPVLFTVLGYPLYAYREMLALAFILCSILVVRASVRRNEGFIIPPSTGVFAFLGALFGARAFWHLQYGDPTQVWRAIFLWQGGLVFYGGLAGGILAVLLVFRFQRIPMLKGLDIIGPYLALGEAITRVGCFLNGCCWGRTTNIPWAISFPKGSGPYNDQLAHGRIAQGAMESLPTHPTQLYLTVMLFAGFLILRAVLQRKRADGQVVAAYGMLYGVVRFTAEAFRDDSARPLLHLTVSQVISLALLLLGLWGWSYLRRRPATPAP